MIDSDAIKKAIEVFEKPSKHIKCVHKCENGMEFLSYSADLVAAFETAIDGLKELEEYRAIGTVEECRESMEKHTPKKPEHFHKKYGKHKWRRRKNGEIDEFAWECDYHNGVSCEVCGETVCVCCNPDYEELDDCEEEYWICPNCDRHIYGKVEYCLCGQHLKW